MSKQLVQRFNQAFRRNKRSTPSSDSHESVSQPEISTDQPGVKTTEQQGRAGREGRTGPGQNHGLPASRAEGTNSAPRAQQILMTPQGQHASLQQTSMGFTGGARAEPSKCPVVTPSQPLKQRGSLQQPHTVQSPPVPLQGSPIAQQSPFSQVGRYSQPSLQSSSSASAARTEPQFSSLSNQAGQGLKGSFQYAHDPGFDLGERAFSPRAEGLQHTPAHSSTMLSRTHSQGRTLSTRRSAPAARAEGNSPVTWSAVPTPDIEDNPTGRSALRNSSLSNLPSQSFASVPEQRHADYVPGMYDGVAAASTPATHPGPQQQQQQQQQQAWFQSQDQQQWPQQLQQQQQQQQLQQQLSRGNSRDYVVDMQALSTVPASSRQTSIEAQQAQRGQGGLGRPSGNPGQADCYPRIAQQVPFYESSPEYMPTTLAARTPISSRVSSYFTGLLRTTKEHSDVEAGNRPASGSSVPAQGPQDTPQPAGCSPKTALFRSGIFQNPRAADQDRPMSPEQAERRAKGLVRTRVEPKVFFANERTFLQWLQISVLLMFTGLSLLGGSSVSSLGGSGEATAACDTTACKASKVGVATCPNACHISQCQLAFPQCVLSVNLACCNNCVLSLYLSKVKCRQ